MAEIKSTLELAMERTKGITISEEDREEIKQKETLQKVNVLFHRYAEGRLPLNEILREIERTDPGIRTVVKGALLSQWIEALSLNEENERLIRGIEALKGKGMEQERAKLDHLLCQYRKEREKMREGLRSRAEEILRTQGIYGSAVVPHIEGSDTWKKESEKLDQFYRMKLEGIKKQLKSLYQTLSG